MNILHGNISEFYCDKGLSYDGLNATLKVQCNNYTLRSDNHYDVACRKNKDGTLEWTYVTRIPKCEIEEVTWGNWTAWSQCSATCDNGTEIRTKTSTIGNVITETRDCFSGVRCCDQSQFQCDGDEDCMDTWGDNADEEDCKYLRVGDTVAIRSQCGNWLSCAGGERGRKCVADDCGDTYLNVDEEADEWDNCTSQVYNYIAAEGRKEGDLIRHGDRVGLRYGWGQWYWLTCQTTEYCETHNCPGQFFDDSLFSSCIGEVYWILSDARKGNCSFGDTSGCKGKPIQFRDYIYLLHDASGTGLWVSGTGGSPRLAPCDVRTSVANNNGEKCHCEKWDISIKKYCT